MKREIILMGLPATGKTTYLAALWHKLCLQETGPGLRLKQFHGNQEYLNLIQEKWVNAELQERTTPSSEAYVSMILEADNMDGEVEVSMPDLSGESYESAWSYRILDNKLAKLLERVEGILLFISPTGISKEILISDADSIMGEIVEEDDSTEEIEETEAWDPSMTPTQTQTVDLIQCALHIRKQLPLRLGIIISAWDRVPDGVCPKDWVIKELPLLWQYIHSNHETIQYQIFGVSAQGGQLPADADRLREIEEPVNRVGVVTEDGKDGYDITFPLHWLMSKQ